MSNWDWKLDGWIIATGVLCATASALLGNFLVLRRLSLLGDAITHAVLPGLAAAFLITGSRGSLVMFVGAAVVGVLTALLTEWIRKHGRVDEGAAMGVTFTTLFAIGLIMIVRAADHVDLDPSCVLHGAIEFAPLNMISFGSFEVPRVAVVLASVLALNVLFVLLCYKELKLCSFDPELARTLGIPSAWFHYGLMTLVAVTAVASFESVGSILVVAMLIVPPAAAYLFTDRLAVMIGLSLVFATLAAVLGHILAIVVPSWFGLRSTSTAGMIATVAGLVFGCAALFAPRHGVCARIWRQQQLAWRIFGEDILAWIYRREERVANRIIARSELATAMPSAPASLAAVLGWLTLRGRLTRSAEGYGLTESGRSLARSIVRSHRLWESYLVQEAGVAAEHIHAQAERLEHFTGKELRDRLDQQTPGNLDPHGSPIPEEPPK